MRCKEKRFRGPQAPGEASASSCCLWMQTVWTCSTFWRLRRCRDWSTLSVAPLLPNSEATSSSIAIKPLLRMSWTGPGLMLVGLGRNACLRCGNASLRKPPMPANSQQKLHHHHVRKAASRHRPAAPQIAKCRCKSFQCKLTLQHGSPVFLSLLVFALQNSQ